jgi:hypothetical protein
MAHSKEHLQSNLHLSPQNINICQLLAGEMQSSKHVAPSHFVKTLIFISSLTLIK